MDIVKFQFLPVFIITIPDTGKSKSFLSFEIGHPSSEYQNILLGAVGEQVTQNYLIGFPEKVDESHIAAENLDERVVYREENGRFIEVERMPGEEYEEQFASREEYLNRMLSDFGGYILGHEWSGHGIIDNGCIDFIQYADFSIA